MLTNYEDRLLDTKEAAEHLKVSPHTLKDWRHKGKGPKYVPLGSTLIRYRRKDLEEFVEKQAEEGGQ